MNLEKIPISDRILEPNKHITHFLLLFFSTEELSLPDIESSESLTDKFKCCVKKAQERILWLNKEEVEKKVCDSYSRYLGYPIQDIHYQLQSAMSQEQSFDNDGQ